MANRYFTKATFDFLRDLKENNDRDWFEEHRGRYEADMKEPALRLIADVAPLLTRVSPRFKATPRSLYRIHRDVRFSRDKRPYKTHIGLHFRHEEAKTAHAPGFYVHVEPGNVFVGLGIWHPPTDALRAIREHIVEKPDEWKRTAASGSFADTFELAGDRLKRPPKGFDADHPLVEELKWKDYIGVAQKTQAFVMGADAPEQIGALFEAGAPFMRFLCDGLGVRFQ